MVGNGVCNIESNNTECNFDGGDCTATTTNPTAGTTIPTTGTTIPTTGTVTNPATTGGCNTGWIGDAYCDDINNNMDCNYDGGDCCGCDVNSQYCSVCECLDPNGSNGETTCPQTTTTSTTTISTFSTTHDPSK